MKVDEATLVILSDALSYHYEGTHVRIERVLDRNAYKAVNDVLGALGGIWRRGSKAHVFTVNAEPLIEDVLLSGSVKTAKEDGFFPTPTSLAEALVVEAGVQAGSTVLEPSAGTGALVAPCLARGAKVYAVEADEGRRRLLIEKFGASGDFILLSVRDFMLMKRSPKLFSHAVMNPPFCRTGVGQHDHLDHVQNAFRLLAPKGVLKSILPSGVHFREDARHRGFRDWVETQGGHIRKLPEGSFKTSGTSVNTVVLTMTKN